jgi:ubiquinone/menaquinone biosynthesis C-methylase UbiE/uncharacterized protein YbaR (Trm112 family)
MEILKKLGKLKQLYGEGVNIIDFIKNLTNENSNSVESIMVSYDLQAGSYIKYAGERKGFIDNYTKSIANIISELGKFETIMEAGVGEATTLANIVSKLNYTPEKIFGFDISWSRIKYAQSYVKSKGLNNSNLFIGDLFNIPVQDNSIDIVYTSHSIEPNGGREKEALQELYRITNKYLILLEPCYELASEEAKTRMNRLGYVKNINNHCSELGYKVIEHRLFDFASNPVNPTGLTIIKKDTSLSDNRTNPLACPVTKSPLEKVKNCYYCKNSLLAYPIIDGVPCLLSNNAVIATHFLSDIDLLLEK